MREGEIEEAAVSINAVLATSTGMADGERWIEWMKAKELDFGEVAGVLNDVADAFALRQWSEEERLRVGILYGIALGMAIVERRGP